MQRTTNTLCHLSFIICFLLTIFACDSTTNEVVTVPTVAPVDEAYVSITLQLPFTSDATRATNKATRAGNAAGSVGAANDGDTYAGVAAERKITSLRVIFYNSSDVVTHVFDARDADAVGGSLSQSPITLRAKKIEKQQYKVLVIANPTARLKQVTNIGDSKTKLDAVAQVTVNDLVTTDGVVMTATKMVLTTDQNFRMTATEAERAAATVKIELERSVAKVFVNPQAGSNITAPNAAGGKAQMVDYSLDVLNTRMFWMRRPAPALSGNGTATTDAPTTPETETTAQAMRYAIDPNMSVLSGAGLQQLTTAAPHRNPISQGGWADDRGIYVTENTMDANAQRGNQTTHAVICLRYVPKQLPELANAADRTWANYKGAYMTLAQLKAKLAAAATAANDNALEMPQGFKADAAHINARYPNINNSTASFEAFNLKFYQNGKNFYLLPIRHFSDAQQPKLEAYGRYGVVRNHLYKINITKVSSAGHPTPVAPTDESNDKVDTYVSANITVMPWHVVTQPKFVLE